MLNGAVSKFSTEYLRLNLRAENSLTCVGKLAQEADHVESSLRVQP